jgi:glutaryl-CoA dehydrogenase (non-decarboxylating)
MDFRLPSENGMIRKMFWGFAVKEVSPIIKEWDRKGEMAPEILPGMAEPGILGICIPVRYGGQGMDYIALGLASEKVEAVDSALRVVLSVHNGLTLFQWGTEAQKQRFLTLLARGEKIGYGAFSEPSAGSDFANIQVTGKRDGGDYVLDGGKMWISLATKADFTVVTIRTDLEAERTSAGLTILLVGLESPGVRRGDILGKLGLHAGSTGWIAMQRVRNMRETSITKRFSTDAAFQAALEAIQVHGEYGYSDEHATCAMHVAR